MKPNIGLSKLPACRKINNEIMGKIIKVNKKGILIENF
jgi:hypothetical protein